MEAPRRHRRMASTEPPRQPRRHRRADYVARPSRHRAVSTAKFDLCAASRGEEERGELAAHLCFLSRRRRFAALHFLRAVQIGHWAFVRLTARPAAFLMWLMRSNAIAHDASMHAEPVQLAISQGSACRLCLPARAAAGESHACSMAPEAFEASWTAARASVLGH